jgi:hypothetical protein
MRLAHEPRVLEHLRQESLGGRQGVVVVFLQDTRLHTVSHVVTASQERRSRWGACALNVEALADNSLLSEMINIGGRYLGAHISEVTVAKVIRENQQHVSHTRRRTAAGTAVGAGRCNFLHHVGRGAHGARGARCANVHVYEEQQYKTPFAKCGCGMPHWEARVLQPARGVVGVLQTKMMTQARSRACARCAEGEGAATPQRASSVPAGRRAAGRPGG